MQALPTLAFDYIPALPEIVLLVFACVVLMIDLFVPEPRRHVSYWLTLLGIAATAAATLYVFHMTPVRTFSNMFVADAFGDLLTFLTCLTVMAMLVYSRSYLAARGLFRGETFVLAMFALLGMLVMISANHFLTLYLGLELMSLSLYAMVALHRESGAAVEAAMKYFVLGALASGLLLYGISMIYGATGTLEINRVTAIIFSGHANGTILIFRIGVRRFGNCVQAGCGPVPHVGARCVPGRADGDHAVHRHRAGVRRVRFHDPDSGRVARCGGLRLAGNADRPVAAVDDRGQRDRDLSVQRQANARVLRHRQHGLHAHGFSHRQHQWLQCGHVLHRNLRDEQPGGLRHGAAPVQGRLRGRKPGRLQGPESTQPVVRVPDAADDVLARGRAADHRLYAKFSVIEAAVDVGLVWLAVVAVLASLIGALLRAYRQADVF